MARKSRIAAQLGLANALPVTIPKPEPKKLKTGIYARLSIRDLGIEDGDTMETQIALLRDYVSEQDDLDLREVYVDNGHTGTTFQRPEFNRLIDDVKNGKINCIVVKDLSRFGRNYLEAGYYLQNVFPSYQVRFIAIYDSFDSKNSDPNSMMVAMKNIVNDYYSKDISRKISATIDLKRSKGPAYSGPPPYGYKMSRSEPKCYVIDKTASTYVHLIFHWAMDGLSYSEIANNLNDMQVPTPKNHYYRQHKKKKSVKCQGADAWTYGTVLGLISNPVYTGDFVCNKTYFRKYDPANSGYVPEEDWIVYPDSHPAYISHEDFDKLKAQREKHGQARKQKRKQQTMIDPPRGNLFSGLLYCGECGRKLTFHRNQKDLKLSTYSCSGKAGKVHPGHPRLSIGFGTLESVVLFNLQTQLRLAIEADHFLKRLSMDDVQSKLKAKRQAELQMLYSKLSSICTRKQKAFEDMVEGILDEDTYHLQIQKLVQETAWLEADVKQAKLRLSEVDTYFTPDNQWLQTFLSARISEELNAPAVHLLIQRIEVWHDKQIRITFYFADWMEKLNNCIAEWKMMEMEDDTYGE